MCQISPRVATTLALFRLKTIFTPRTLAGYAPKESYRTFATNPPEVLCCHYPPRAVETPTYHVRPKRNLSKHACFRRTDSVLSTPTLSYEPGRHPAISLNATNVHAPTPLLLSVHDSKTADYRPHGGQSAAPYTKKRLLTSSPPLFVKNTTAAVVIPLSCSHQSPHPAHLWSPTETSRKHSHTPLHFFRPAVQRPDGKPSRQTRHTDRRTFLEKD